MKTILLNLKETLSDITITEDSEIFAFFEGHDQDSVAANFRIIHKCPGLKSRITVKAVLHDQSRFDFSPLLIMEKGAKLCDSYLKIAVLMLSASAHAIAIPSLEIHENDVKAGHGATIGRPDGEQLLYLCSRGLTTVEAEKLLIEAFTADLPPALVNFK